MGNESSTQQLLMMGMPHTSIRVFKRDVLNFMRSDFGNHGDLTKATPEDLLVLTKDYIGSESFQKFRLQMGPCATTGKLLDDSELLRQLLRVVTRWIEKERAEQIAMNPAAVAADAIRTATSTSSATSMPPIPRMRCGGSVPSAPHGVSMPSAPHGVSIPSAPHAPRGGSVSSTISAVLGTRGAIDDLPPAYSEPAARTDPRTAVAGTMANLALGSNSTQSGGKHVHRASTGSRKSTSPVSPVDKSLQSSPHLQRQSVGKVDAIPPAHAAVAAPPFPPPSAPQQHNLPRDERLLELVHQISEYISQCEEHSVQMTRDMASSERERQAAQVRAMTFANLRMDVGSRVEAFLNQDHGARGATGKGAGEGQVTNYCLWS